MHVLGQRSRPIADRVSKSVECLCDYMRIKFARARCERCKYTSLRRVWGVELVVYSESLWHRQREFFTHG